MLYNKKKKQQLRITSLLMLNVWIIFLMFNNFISITINYDTRIFVCICSFHCGLLLFMNWVKWVLCFCWLIFVHTCGKYLGVVRCCVVLCMWVDEFEPETNVAQWKRSSAHTKTYKCIKLNENGTFSLFSLYLSIFFSQQIIEFSVFLSISSYFFYSFFYNNNWLFRKHLIPRI